MFLGRTAITTSRLQKPKNGTRKCRSSLTSTSRATSASSRGRVGPDPKCGRDAGRQLVAYWAWLTPCRIREGIGRAPGASSARVGGDHRGTV